MKIAVAGGHSKACPGASGYIDEYTEDRKVANALIQELKNRGHSVANCSNEKGTQSSELAEECRLANASGANLFVAIHFNAGGGTGCEVWHYTSSSSAKSYAAKVSSQLASKMGLKNRGAKGSTGLYVLKHTTMTAILVEVCFVDTKSDCDTYNRVGYQAVAAAIADAISGTTSGVTAGGSGTSSTDPARSTQLYTPNNTDAQKWYPEWEDDEFFRLKNVACGKYLDVKSAGNTSGTAVRVYPENGTDAQLWKMKKVDGSYKPEFLAPVEIIPKVNEDLRLDCVSGGLTDGTGTQIYESNGTGAQQWTIVDLGNGQWTLINNQSAKALDVVSGGK